MSGKWSRAMVVAAAMLALTTACSGDKGGGDGVASLNGDKKDSGQGDQQASGTDEDKMREFTKCMRDNGVDMPEPGADGRVEIQAGVAGADGDDKMTKAHEACSKLLPNGGKPKEMSPEDLDKARQQAKCMREHGIDMPDPDPNSPGMTINLGDADKDKMDKAFKECGMGTEIGSAPAAGGGK